MGTTHWAVFFQPQKPLRGSQPTGRREGEVGGIEEAVIEFDVGVEAATGVKAPDFKTYIFGNVLQFPTIWLEQK